MVIDLFDYLHFLLDKACKDSIYLELIELQRELVGRIKKHILWMAKALFVFATEFTLIWIRIGGV
uniref:Uncharacterized protein n=1 Tax=Rhizophora mucronata TaxID=61149 RepID=A0A2P2QHR6_RHIMU